MTRTPLHLNLVPDFTGTADDEYFYSRDDEQNDLQREIVDRTRAPHVTEPLYYCFSHANT